MALGFGSTKSIITLGSDLSLFLHSCIIHTPMVGPVAVREHTHLVFHSRSEGSADLGEPLKSQLNCSEGGTVHATGQDFAVYQVNSKAYGF